MEALRWVAFAVGFAFLAFVYLSLFLFPVWAHVTEWGTRWRVDEDGQRHLNEDVDLEPVPWIDRHGVMHQPE